MIVITQEKKVVEIRLSSYLRKLGNTEPIAEKATGIAIDTIKVAGNSVLGVAKGFCKRVGQELPVRLKISW